VSEETTGLLVLLALAVAAALAAHGASRRFGRASAASALAAETLFVAADAWRAGYLDPFAPVAWAVALLLAFAVSAVVGLAVRALRGRGR